MLSSLVGVLLLGGLAASSALSKPLRRAPNHGHVVAATGNRTTNSTSRDCSYQSVHHTAWAIHDFTFNSTSVYTTPQDFNSAAYVYFTLSNFALSYRPVCTAFLTEHDSEDEFDNNQVFSCTNVPFGDKASFSVDMRNSSIQVKQWWTCPNDESFSAEGDVTPAVHCTSAETKNPNWKPGEIYWSSYSVCRNPHFSLPMTTISAAE